MSCAHQSCGGKRRNPLATAGKTQFFRGGGFHRHRVQRQPHQVGDTFTIKPGCNKQLGDIDTTGHCINKFSNGANHQGAPKTPGKDRMIRSTD